MVRDFNQSNSIINQFVAEIRNVEIQTDRLRFRRNLERIGEMMAYEISKTLDYEMFEVETPLGTAQVDLPAEIPVLATILRAGLPMHQGFLNVFDTAENAFISAYRKHTSETDFEIIVEYSASPNLENKTLILVDPMLATGQSLVSVFEGLKKHGTPKEIHLVCVIGATDGIKYIEEHLPEDTKLWIATVDQKLNSKGYIVPGLGDAGDLSYGQKL